MTYRSKLSPTWGCGHPRTPENTVRVGVDNGVRCRTCRIEINKKSRLKLAGRIEEFTA